ncbi:MAG: flagellar basal body P-ring formation protein FlgA [Desulfuromonadaceae bacterium]|nr:flagellar basal body P-ring formation protein FlgA [Desulfuromonadaceae bacterium]
MTELISRKVFLPLLILIAMLWSSAAYAEPLPAGSKLYLELRAEALVAGDEISLCDVVVAKPVVPQLCELQLGRSPNAGQSRQFDRAFVLRALQRGGLDPSSVIWTGADGVTVTRDGERVRQVDVEATIGDFLELNRKRFGAVEMRFESHQSIEDFYLPRGELTVEVIPAVKELIGSRSLTLVYRVDQHIVKNLAVRGKLLVYADVAVARHNLPRGTLLTAAQIQMARLDVSDLNGPFFSLAALEGMRLMRNVRAGEAIEHRQVEQPPVIKKGDFVKIVAARGGMRLTATGVAREDGRVGQVISVRNSASLKDVLAEVIDQDFVRVEF